MPDWDAAVETVEVAPLWAEAAVGPNGSVGAPWLKMGWHHAYLVLRDGVRDPETRRRADALHERLAAGESVPERQRLTLERELVSTLRAGCERIVAGYTLRTEPLNADYSGGVENAAYDAQAGLGSAIFPRTVKLKDFPWNGWLTVGVPERPSAAWNPVAGFTDPTGRLLWLTLGDPAFFPSPHGTGWVPNRVTVSSVELGAPSLAVPEEALAFEPGTGALRAVGPGRRAGARVVYRVLASRFHDDTKLEAADLLYALGLAWRTQDPAVMRATAQSARAPGSAADPADRDRCARVRRGQADLRGADRGGVRRPAARQPGRDGPDRAPMDDGALARAGPRGGGGRPRPRGILARERPGAWRARGSISSVTARSRRALRALLDELAGRRHVPAALVGRVTPEEAEARWAALRAFHEASGHFLVTNGPYRLASWTEDTSVLQVFRDLSYPRGLGTFNSHALPLRAFVTGVEARTDELVLKAEVERLDRFGREYQIVREPFVKRVLEQDRRSLPVGHYVVVGPDGAVAAAGTVEASDPGDYRVDLRAVDRPGQYVALVALAVDDNRTDLPVKVVPWTR